MKQPTIKETKMNIDEIGEALKDIKNQLPSNSMSRRISSTVGLRPNTLLVLIKLAEDVCKGNYIHKEHILYIPQPKTKRDNNKKS